MDDEIFPGLISDPADVTDSESPSEGRGDLIGAASEVYPHIGAEWVEAFEVCNALFGKLGQITPGNHGPRCPDLECPSAEVYQDPELYLSHLFVCGDAGDFKIPYEKLMHRPIEI